MATHRGVHPARLALKGKLDDDVVEQARGGQKLGQARAKLCVDQHGARGDAKAAEQVAKKQGKVFAIAVAAAQHLAGCGRHLPVQLQAYVQIAEVILNQTQGLLDPFRQGRACCLDAADLLAESILAFSGGPGGGHAARHDTPIGQIGELKPGIGQHPGRRLLFYGGTLAQRTAPRPAKEAGLLSGAGLADFRRADGSGGKVTQAARGPVQHRPLVAIDRIVTRQEKHAVAVFRQQQWMLVKSVGELQAVARTHILEEGQQGVVLLQDKSAQPLLACHDSDLCGIRVFDDFLSAPDLQRVQSQSLGDQVEVEPPLRELLHRLHGLEPQHDAGIGAAHLGIKLLVVKQAGDHVLVLPRGGTIKIQDVRPRRGGLESDPTLEQGRNTKGGCGRCGSGDECHDELLFIKMNKSLFGGRG